LKQDALLPLLFNFALKHAIYEGSGRTGWLEINGAHQLLVYADDVQILQGSIHGIKKNTEILVDASKESGTEVNADNLYTWSYPNIRSLDEVKTQRLIINPLRGGTVPIFRNNLNKSKFYSGRN
jgi:hypothetical protein